MSWLFSLALVEAYSADTCSDGEPSAPLSVMLTRRRFWRKDKMMGHSTHFPSGLTSRRLTATRGRAVLRSFLEDFPVRTSAQQGRGQGSPAAGQGYGDRWPGSLARYCQISSSWKTRQLSLLVGSTEFSGTWPRWGSMRNGECWEQRTWVRTTKGTGYGYWPTSNVPNGGRRVPNDATIKGGSTPTAYRHGKKMQVGLEQEVQWWPTPTVCGNYNRKGCSPTSGDGLATAVKMFPTPAARDYRSPNKRPYSARGGGKKGEQLPNAVGGQLNPPWVEWLMGWPIGWTGLEPLAMGRFRQWLRKHGED